MPSLRSSKKKTSRACGKSIKKLFRVADSLLSSLNEVVETKTGEPKKKSQALGKGGIPSGFVDLNEVTLDSHPEMFSKNTAKVGKRDARKRST